MIVGSEFEIDGCPYPGGTKKDQSALPLGLNFFTLVTIPLGPASQSKHIDIVVCIHEAFSRDKMLELGFEPDINAILDHCPQKKQTVLFSATFPENIKSLAKRYLHKPNEISIEESEENLSTIELMAYEYPTSEDRFSILIRVFLQHPEESILIFCNQRTVVDEIVAELQEKNISCLGLHGLHEQQDREKTLTLFKNQSLRVLVATDVAARGIDIENLALVINYDFPLNEDTFIHRIGRTGRNGASGKAITLIKDFEEKTLLDYASKKN